MDEEADVVPSADGLAGVEGLAGLGIDGRLIEGMQPSAAHGIGGELIVFQLKLRACRPDGWGPVLWTWNMMPLLPAGVMLYSSCNSNQSY